jgi:splicing factor 3A subunit 2
MAKRAAMEAAEKEMAPAPQKRVAIRKTVKIGRPGYRVTKQFNPEDGTKSLLFQIEYPEISDGEKPRHRFMSAIEQRKETTDWRYQYLLFAAEPYETICFKIPNMEVDNSKKDVHLFRHWDQDGKVYSLQIPFKSTPKKSFETAPLAPPGGGGAAIPPPPTFAGSAIPPPPS